MIKGLTEKYNVNKLVYYELTGDIKSAIAREKQLKKWNRKWKLDSIEKHNPNWNDLSKNRIPNQVACCKQVGNDK